MDGAELKKDKRGLERKKKKMETKWEKGAYKKASHPYLFLRSHSVFQISFYVKSELRLVYLFSPIFPIQIPFAKS